MLISRQALNEYLDRRLESYLWMKGLTRRDLEEELAYLHVKPVFKTRPWLHQLVCFFIALSNPRFLFLLDMGLGKSKILLDVMTHRRRTKRLRRGLITVPNTVNMESWKDDAERHSELEPWACDVPDIEAKRDMLLDPEGDFTIIDYQGLVLALCDKVKGKKAGKLVLNHKRVGHVQRLYNFSGVDESHKLRNHQNLWFEMMLEVTSAMDYVYATTGTVFGKDPEAMWSQFRIVDGGETFGENLGLFHAAFFGLTNDNFSSKWTFNRRSAPEVNRMMQHRSIRYDEREVPELELPTRMPPVIHRLRMAGEQRDHYLRALDGLLQAQGTGNAQAMDAPWTRMRQIVSGYLTWKDDRGEHTVRFKENPKLDDLEASLFSMGDAKMVVCHYYTETGQMICDRLEDLGFDYEWLYGGTKDKAGARRRFMDDPKKRVFVMNTEAGGTGTDGLQKVARYMYFYESPTPPDVRGQVEKRIHRPGQPERTWFIDPVMRGSMDQTILDNIAEGRDLYDAVVNGRRMTRALLDRA